MILDMRSPGSPVAELTGHQGALSAISWGSGGDTPGSSSGGWIASCGMSTSEYRPVPLVADLRYSGDDSQVLMYDLCSPLPAPRPSSRNPTSSRNGPSPSPSYSLSPPTTPSRNRSTPSPAPSVEMRPSKAWTAGGQVNNLSFTDTGDWLGTVHGQKFSLLRV